MWTTEQVQEIRDHVSKGLSRGAIAQIYGVTRNAMVGLCYRHAINGPNNEMVGRIVATRKRRANLLRSVERPNLPEKATTDRWLRKAKPVTFKIEFEARPDEPVPLRISLRDLNDSHCHNPIGETDDDCYPFYCGHPTQDNSSYCPFHNDLFHTTWRRRR